MWHHCANKGEAWGKLSLIMRGLTPYLMSVREQPWMNHLWCHETVSHLIWCHSGSSYGINHLWCNGINHLWCPEGSHTVSDVPQGAAMGYTISDVMRGLTPYLMSPRKQPWMNHLWCPEGVSHLIWCHPGSSHGWTISDVLRGSHTLSDVPQGAAMDEPSLMPWRVSHLIWCHSGSSYGINHLWCNGINRLWCPEGSHTLSDVPQGAAMG